MTTAGDDWGFGAICTAAPLETSMAAKRVRSRASVFLADEDVAFSDEEDNLDGSELESAPNDSEHTL